MSGKGRVFWKKRQRQSWRRKKRGKGWDDCHLQRITIRRIRALQCEQIERDSAVYAVYTAAGACQAGYVETGRTLPILSRRYD